MWGLLGKFIGYNPEIEDPELEDRYIAEVEKNNRELLENTDFIKNIKVVLYVIDLNKPDTPRILVICDFHGDIIPDNNSVIWAPDIKHEYLAPYMVLRIDFMEDEENGIPIMLTTMIVVKPIPPLRVMI